MGKPTTPAECAPNICFTSMPWSDTYFVGWKTIVPNPANINKIISSLGDLLC